VVHHGNPASDPDLPDAGSSNSEKGIRKSDVVYADNDIQMRTERK